MYDIILEIDCDNLLELLLNEVELDDSNILNIRNFIKNKSAVDEFCLKHKFETTEFIRNMVHLFPTAFTTHLIKYIRKHYNFKF